MVCSSWSDIRVRIQIWFLVFESWTSLVVSTFAVSIMGGPVRCPTLHVGSLNTVGVMLLFLDLVTSNITFPGTESATLDCTAIPYHWLCEKYLLHLVSLQVGQCYPRPGLWIPQGRCLLAVECHPLSILTSGYKGLFRSPQTVSRTLSGQDDSEFGLVLCFLSKTA